MTPVTLTDEQLKQLADMVAARLTRVVEPATADLVDAKTLAALLGISRQTVYSNAAALAGERIGNGKGARWRFDVAAARAAMSVHCSTSKPPASTEDGSNASAGNDSAPSERRVTRRRSTGMPNGLPPAGAILKSRPRAAS